MPLPTSSLPESTELERKALPFELKADANGEFIAVFATFDVIDHDGDVTVPGAFEDGAKVIVGSWGHKTHELPVGKGVIRTSGSDARVEGKFFLETRPGRDTYETVKALDDQGEWSYVFRVTKQSFGERDDRPVRFLEGIDVFSVDPVLAGAGIDTRTVTIKGLDRGLTFLEHSSEIEKALAEYVARVKERAAVREKEGRGLSSANVDQLSAIAESWKAATADLEKLLAETSPQKDDHEQLVKAALRAQRTLAGIARA